MDQENFLEGLINDYNPELLKKDLAENGSSSGDSRDQNSVPRIYMKKEGTYNFFLCPPFESYSKDTPWGGRPYLVYKKHWNLPDAEGKKRQLIDYNGSFPWLGFDNSLNETIKNWSEKGLSSEVEDYLPVTGVALNVILLESPDEDHQKYINTFDKDGNLIGDEPVVCVLEQSITTLKWLQEQLDNSYIKYPIYHPINGSIISIKKASKQTKSGKRTEYKRSLIPHSPRWFSEADSEKSKVLIKDVLENRMHNLYKLYSPNKFSLENLKDFSKRIDGILTQKFSHIQNSSVLQSSMPENQFSSEITKQEEFKKNVKQVSNEEAKPFITEEDSSKKGEDKDNIRMSPGEAFELPDLPEGF